MRHKRLTAKLGRTSEHRRAMVTNMMTSLFLHERIKTTVDKAKETKRFAEKMITTAKKNTLHARRVANRRIKDEEALDRLFSTIAPRYASRNGGYTRIIRLGHRLGDGAEMVYLELVDRIAPTVEKESKKKERKEEKPEAGTETVEATEDVVTEEDTTEAETAEEKPKKKTPAKKSADSKKTAGKAKKQKAE